MCLIAVALVLAAGCAMGGVSHVQLGEKVATRDGNVVTVFGWVESSAHAETGGQGSGLELESCRTRRNGLLLDAGNFKVRTTSGTVLPAGGSNFTAEADCVRGQVFFQLPGGDEPEYAQYRAGRKVLRWKISTKGG